MRFLTAFMRTAVLGSVVFGIAVSSNGCAPRVRPVASTVLPPVAECDPLPGLAEMGDSIVVALTETVSAAHAPEPRNESERIVFRNLYQTLVTVDCQGQVHPALAESYSVADSGRVWTFILREGLSYWDETPVHALDVKQSWIDARAAEPDASRRLPWIWLDPHTESVIAFDARCLSVRLRVSQGETPELFAHPALAVAERRRGGGWPLGTGPFEVAEADLGNDLLCHPRGGRIGDGHVRSPVRFHLVPGEDPRNLPEGVDALLVRDRSVIDYFAATQSYEAIPLPWNRLYLLLAPGARAPSDSSAAPVFDELDPMGAIDRSELARHVVVSDARPAPTITFVDSTSAACIDLIRASTESWRRGGVPAGNRIAYREDDPDARRLAERLAALASTGGDPSRPQSLPIATPPPRAKGLPAEAFATALRSAEESAYIVRLERRYVTGCLDLAALPESVPWILDGRPLGEDGKESVLSLAGATVPLIVTRPYLLARRGLAGVAIDYDGALRFDRAGWSRDRSSRREGSP